MPLTGIPTGKSPTASPACLPCRTRRPRRGRCRSRGSRCRSCAGRDRPRQDRERRRAGRERLRVAPGRAAVGRRDVADLRRALDVRVVDVLAVRERIEVVEEREARRRARGGRVGGDRRHEVVDRVRARAASRPRSRSRVGAPKLGAGVGVGRAGHHAERDVVRRGRRRAGDAVHASRTRRCACAKASAGANVMPVPPAPAVPTVVIVTVSGFEPRSVDGQRVAGDHAGDARDLDVRVARRSPRPRASSAAMRKLRVCQAR